MVARKVVMRIRHDNMIGHKKKYLVANVKNNPKNPYPLDFVPKAFLCQKNKNRVI